LIFSRQTLWPSIDLSKEKKMKISSIIKETGDCIIQSLKENFTGIPKHTCCGKPVTFVDSNKDYKCSICHTVWNLKVTVVKAERTDWNKMEKEVETLLKRLLQKPNNLKRDYRKSAEGILNAFRVGDISFDRAADELEAWKKKP
jgi:hypothetical protein